MPGKWYKRKSIRLPDYDYSRPGVYFITICTNDRTCVLGVINNGRVKLNRLGQLVDSCWNRIPEHHKNVQLDQYVIMPNHLHGILLFLDKDEGAAGCAPTTDSTMGPRVKLKPGSLSVIIRSFKSSVTKMVRETDSSWAGPFWQRSYYEHVIRNETDMKQVREYIVTNPLRWSIDRENISRAFSEEF